MYFFISSSLPKNEQKQFDLRYHSSKVKFIRSFFRKNSQLDNLLSSFTDLYHFCSLKDILFINFFCESNLQRLNRKKSWSSLLLFNIVWKLKELPKFDALALLWSSLFIVIPPLKNKTNDKSWSASFQITQKNFEIYCDLFYV